jgi:hypothetical protein
MNTVLHAEIITPEQWVQHLELSFTSLETMAKKAIDFYVSGPRDIGQLTGSQSAT